MIENDRCVRNVVAVAGFFPPDCVQNSPLVGLFVTGFVLSSKTFFARYGKARGGLQTKRVTRDLNNLRPLVVLEADQIDPCVDEVESARPDDVGGLGFRIVDQRRRTLFINTQRSGNCGSDFTIRVEVLQGKHFVLWVRTFLTWEQIAVVALNDLENLAISGKGCRVGGCRALCQEHSADHTSPQENQRRLDIAAKCPDVRSLGHHALRLTSSRTPTAMRSSIVEARSASG